MPLPNPRKGQQQDDFMNACMSNLSSEFPDEKQRAAVCFRQWRGNKSAVKNSQKKLTINLTGFEKPEYTPEGFLIVPVIIAKKTVLTYAAYENPDGEETHELLGDAIFSEEYLKSCDGCPFVLDHPLGDDEDHDVKPDNYSYLIKGILYDPRPIREQNMVVGKLKIFDKYVIKLIESGKLTELSQGYTCERVDKSGTWDSTPYNYEQTNVVQNHLALVSEGRAGADVRVLYNSKTKIESEDFERIIARRNYFMKKRNFDEPGTTSKEKDNRRNEPKIGEEGYMNEEAPDMESKEQDKLDKILTGIEKIAQILEKVSGAENRRNEEDENRYNDDDENRKNEKVDEEDRKNEKADEDEKKNRKNQNDPVTQKDPAQIMNSIRRDLPSQIAQQIQRYSVARTNASARATALLGGVADELALKYPEVDAFNRAVLIASGFSANRVERMNSLQVEAHVEARAELAKTEINRARTNSYSDTGANGEALAMTNEDF